jgi:hypothetical protein
MNDSCESQSGAALRAALDRRGFAYSRIVGTSMLPTLSPGDIVLIRPCLRPRPGDVVTFVLDGRLVTHRLVHVDAAGLVCRGDNRLCSDRRVESQALVGCVAEVVGHPTPNRTAELVRVRLRWRWREDGVRLARLRDQVSLFACSIAGRPPAGDGHPPIFGLVPGVTGSDCEHVVSHGDLADPVALSRLVRDAAVVLPASLFGSLSAAQRYHLLTVLSGRRVDVFAVPVASAGRAVRTLGAARRAVGRLGLSAGQPGDVAARGVDGTPYVLHAFTAAELTTELSDAGLGDVAVATVCTESGPLLHAWGR